MARPAATAWSPSTERSVVIAASSWSKLVLFRRSRTRRPRGSSALSPAFVRTFTPRTPSRMKVPPPSRLTHPTAAESAWRRVNGVYERLSASRTANPRGAGASRWGKPPRLGGRRFVDNPHEPPAAPTLDHRTRHGSSQARGGSEERCRAAQSACTSEAAERLWFRPAPEGGGPERRHASHFRAAGIRRRLLRELVGGKGRLFQRRVAGLHRLLVHGLGGVEEG